MSRGSQIQITAGLCAALITKRVRKWRRAQEATRHHGQPHGVAKPPHSSTRCGKAVANQFSVRTHRITIAMSCFFFLGFSTYPGWPFVGQNTPCLYFQSAPTWGIAIQSP